MALDDRAALFLEELYLFFCFHSFGHDFQFQCILNVQDGLQQVCRLCALRHIVQEFLIDLWERYPQAGPAK